jgi:crotonobetainyl-CoA:carnitine CoA-transferase CaiB-like acyl-CoA transferase
MYAYSGILTALLARSRTGRGMRVEVTMLEALAEWMGFPLYFAHYGGRAPERSGASHPAIAPYGPHRAGDGSEVIFGLQNEREWTTFCAEVLRRPELAVDERFASNSRRVEHRAELTLLIEQSFARLGGDEVRRRLDDAGIANGRLNAVADVMSHPQLAGRGRWREVGTCAGAVKALLPPATLSGVEPVMGDVPALGAHTDAVLRSLGFGETEIGAMRASGAI